MGYGIGSFGFGMGRCQPLLLRDLCRSIPLSFPSYSSSTLTTFPSLLAPPSLLSFVCMNDGGILEAVGSFENMACKDIPGRGELATFASDDKTFEAHLNLDLVSAWWRQTQTPPHPSLPPSSLNGAGGF